STVYTVTGTDTKGCVNTNTTSVLVNNLPTITINTASICIGQQTATLTANGASTYTWSPNVNLSATTGNPVTATPSSTQAYTVSGTDANGCVNAGSTTVTVNPLPTVVVTSAAICLGQQTATLTAAGAGTYAWSPNIGISATTGNPITANPGSTQAYTVTGTDANGCVSNNTSTVTVNSLPTVTASSTSVCPGYAGTINAGGAVTYTWSTTQQGSSLTDSPPATNSYTVVGTDANTCTNTAVGTIVVYNNFTISATSATVCAAGQQTATLTANGANTYTWSPAAGLSATTGSSVYSTPNAVSSVYQVIGTSAVGSCTATTTATLVVNSLPLPVAVSNTPCLNQALSFTCTPGGLSNYVWAGPNAYSATGANPSIPVSTATLAGIYTVTVTDNNTPACVNYTTVTVAIFPLPVITASASPVCIGQTIHLSASGGVLYQWSGPGTPAFSSTLQNPTVANATLADAGNYVVLGTDGHGCQSGNVVNAIVNPLPIIAVNTATICVGQQTATLTATGANTYVWTAGTAPSNGNVVNATPSVNTSYTVTGTDVNGCVDTAVTSVSVWSLPTVSTNTVNPDCIPLCTSFSVSVSPAASTYSWTLGNGQSSSSAAPAACYTVSGTSVVKVTVADINGCVNTATTTVTTFAKPTANFDYGPQPVTILAPNVQFSNLSTAGLSSYHWTFGDGGSSALMNPGHLYNEQGNYQVTLAVATASGCMDTITKTVIIKDDYVFYVPNAFTPNGDNLNDLFLPIASGIKTYKLYIYDRWGNLTFYSEDLTKGWDGTYMAKGSEVVQEDVYVWKIEATDHQDKARHLAGTVTLIK
ncbi:MAG: gliding motility-associated C-terminal domain-containing protein, partial [Bacteroidetes bacterium]|nr:gliding motility-associated C-terminal domain-containing protein [Bacteroidota bacterium]